LPERQSNNSTNTNIFEKRRRRQIKSPSVGIQTSVVLIGHQGMISNLENPIPKWLEHIFLLPTQEVGVKESTPDQCRFLCNEDMRMTSLVENHLETWDALTL
jgi:hypothetical protein